MIGFDAQHQSIALLGIVTAKTIALSMIFRFVMLKSVTINEFRGQKRQFSQQCIQNSPSILITSDVCGDDCSVDALEVHLKFGEHMFWQIIS